MTKGEAVNWIINLSADIGKIQHQELWHYEQALSEIREILEAEPERTGRWIIRDNPGTGWYRITCSECGEDVTATAPCIGFFPNAKVNWDYCPNCGADMREPEDIPMEYFESGGR